MYRLSRIGFPLILVIALGAPLYAADHQFMVPEEDTIELILLRQKSVRDELKISDDVAGHIQRYAKEQWQKAQKLENENAQEQTKKFDEMAKENKQFLEKNLNKSQRDRLEQIVLQVAGLMYVTRSDIAEKLKLTADQKQKAVELRRGAIAELEKLIDAKNAKSRHTEIVALWDINHERLEKLLTDSQKATWKQLAGPEFKGEFTYAAN